MITHHAGSRIGQGIQAARAAARLSAGDLADRLGLSEVELLTYEHGVRPGAATLAAIAVALRVPLSALFDRGAGDR